MHEFAIYSVIPPEGCAAILWRDAGRKVEAAEALKLTAPDLLALGLVDEIVKEPVGGAHTDPARAAALLDETLSRALADAAAVDVPTRLELRYEKFRKMGSEGIVDNEELRAKSEERTANQERPRTNEERSPTPEKT